MMRAIALALGFALICTAAWAQNPPPLIGPGQGADAWVANQATKAVPYSPVNGKLFAATRGLFVAGTAGGAACVIVMKLQVDASAQTWSNVHPGAVLPVSVVDIESTNTTCVGILLLY